MTKAIHSIAAVAGLALAAVTAAGAPAASAHTAPQHGTPNSRSCAPNGTALGYSDALDKLSVDGVTVGGLSDLAYDARSRAWASTVDNHATDPSRIWFFRDLADPHVVGAPLVLKNADGTPYDGTTADNEGLAVLPDGDYLVSSETEPSIRVFGRDGVQRGQLPVPARFAVSPNGEATPNATLEGLTISPSGHTIVAAMEGALSGDTDATLHRFLVYTAGRHGAWTLSKQVAYRAEPGQRVPEVAALDDDSLLVEEASFSTTIGNAVDVWLATGLRHARDVSSVGDLAAKPGAALHKTLLADVVSCPTLGAPSKETQTNPLLDNFEGMAVTGRGRHGTVGVSLISDDNFSTGQTTRVLNLAVRLPAHGSHR